MLSLYGGDYQPREHYHVTLVSGHLSAVPFVTNNKFEADDHYNKAVMGYSVLLGAKILNLTPTAALFDDGAVIRCFACEMNCMEVTAQKT